MAGELAASRRQARALDDSISSARTCELDERRRYIETILERIATGVVSVDADGRDRRRSTRAALRLLDLDRSGRRRSRRDAVFDARGPAAARARCCGAAADRRNAAPRRRSRSCAKAASCTSPPRPRALHGEDGALEGAVLVFDDVTPLIRTQKVAAWRDVARRLAHEIKNPLTPIQLSRRAHAPALRRRAAAGARLVDECTTTIVGEVESLKELVDEFSQFARMPAPRAVPTDLHALLDRHAGALRRPLHATFDIERRFAAALPPVRSTPSRSGASSSTSSTTRSRRSVGQRRRRADGEPPTIVIETQHDRVNGVVRIVVADNGPGIPAAERDKLFMPYYSTKRRGSGLGLAIVRRIIAEHGGSIEVGDNVPHGHAVHDRAAVLTTAIVPEARMAGCGARELAAGMPRLTVDETDHPDRRRRSRACAAR